MNCLERVIHRESLIECIHERNEREGPSTSRPFELSEQQAEFIQGLFERMARIVGGGLTVPMIRCTSDVYFPCDVFLDVEMTRGTDTAKLTIPIPRVILDQLTAYEWVEIEIACIAKVREEWSA
jgi:hypothetical protein